MQIDKQNAILYKAKPEDVVSVFHIVESRVSWMDKNGIRQWNYTAYLEAYPVEYYQAQQMLGNLYVVKDNSREIILGAAVLLETDDRWPDRQDNNAVYIHNLVTDVQAHGVGKLILAEAEKIAKEKHKRFLRLDCAEDNEFLNNYYRAQGFILQEGQWSRGDYHGNRLQKDLWSGTEIT